MKSTDRRGVKSMEQTTDYKIFKNLASNRRLNATHVRKLIESITENNLSRYYPILVNDRMEIIDGQHRLQALKKLKLPVYYQIAKSGSIREIILLNSNSRQWTSLDYLNSFIARGNKDYLLLKDFMEKYDMSLACSLLLLSPTALSKNKSMLREFRSGDFVVGDIESATVMAEKISALRPFMIGNPDKDRDFIRALMTAYHGITHEDLMRKLEETGLRIMRELSRKEYLRRIEDIINFKRSNKIRFF